MNTGGKTVAKTTTIAVAIGMVLPRTPEIFVMKAAQPHIAKDTAIAVAVAVGSVSTLVSVLHSEVLTTSVHINQDH